MTLRERVYPLHMRCGQSLEKGHFYSRLWDGQWSIINLQIRMMELGNSIGAPANFTPDSIFLIFSNKKVEHIYYISFQRDCSAAVNKIQQSCFQRNLRQTFAYVSIRRYEEWKEMFKSVQNDNASDLKCRRHFAEIKAALITPFSSQFLVFTTCRDLKCFSPTTQDALNQTPNSLLSSLLLVLLLQQYVSFWSFSNVVWDMQ